MRRAVEPAPVDRAWRPAPRSCRALCRTASKPAMRHGFFKNETKSSGAIVARCYPFETVTGGSPRSDAGYAGSQLVELRWRLLSPPLRRHATTVGSESRSSWNSLGILSYQTPTMSTRTVRFAALLFAGMSSAHLGFAQSASVSPLATGGATSADLGEVHVRLVVGRAPDTARITLAAGRGTAVLDAEAADATALSLTAVDVGDGRPTVVAVRMAADGSARFLVVDVDGARPRVLATLGPVTSDEEHAARLVVEPAPTSAQLDLAVEVRSHDACGEVVQRVFPHRLDRATRRAHALGSLATGPLPSATIVATPRASDAARPTFSTLVFDSAVGSEGPTRRGLDALSDDDATSRFPTSTESAFGSVRARYPYAPLRLVALVVEPIAGPTGGRDFVVRAGDRAFAVHSPAGTGPVEARFPAPLDARCLVLETTGGPDALAAMVQVYGIPEADGSSAIERLVTDLADEGERSDLAAEALARIGSPALAILERAFEEAPAGERRRILRAAEAMVAREPNALRVFVQAIESGDASLVALAVERCVAMGSPGHRALAAAVRRGRPEVSRALAERAPDLALESILARLPDASTDGEKTMLREALVVAARRSPVRGREQLRSFASRPGDPSVRALALTVLRSAGDTEGVAAALDQWLAEDVEQASVEVQIRWLEAASTVPAERRSNLVRSLSRRSLQSEFWMVRERALHAIVGDPEALALLRTALDDPSPRVRATALAALDGDAESLRRVGELSRRDPWPNVRLAALRSLMDVAQAERLLRDALTDPSTRVRIGLLESLSNARDARFVADAVGIVERNRAPTPVVVAAVRYLEALCAAQSEAVLEATIPRALERDSERNRTIAIAAAHALERFGGPESVRSARRLYDPTRGSARGPERCDPLPVTPASGNR